MIRCIYISWRKQIGEQRYIIAKIKRNVSEGIVFKYLKGFEDAKKDGLDFFLGFKDESKLSPESVSNLLSLRTISKERPNRNEYLDFWGARNVNDIFDILGLTQGKSPTDNFEFLARFYPEPGLTFVTDIASLSHQKLPVGTLIVGDKLTYRPEPANKFDKKAVAVFKGETKIGYIKKIHNEVFLDKTKHYPKLTVQALDENGIIKQVFVKVQY